MRDIAQGVLAEDIRIVRRLHVKYAGTDTALPVNEESPAAMTRTFGRHTGQKKRPHARGKVDREARRGAGGVGEHLGAAR